MNGDCILGQIRCPKCGMLDLPTLISHSCPFCGYNPQTGEVDESDIFFHITRDEIEKIYSGVEKLKKDIEKIQPSEKHISDDSVWVDVNKSLPETHETTHEKMVKLRGEGYSMIGKYLVASRIKYGCDTMNYTVVTRNYDSSINEWYWLDIENYSILDKDVVCWMEIPEIRYDE